MSRSAPPAEIDANWQSSATSRTLAPLPCASAIIASRPAVDAMPASSTMINVSGPMSINHCGVPNFAALSGSVQWTYLSRVSVVAPRSSPSTIAAAAVGAKPRTCPPELRHACASAAMAVVLPAPAGARASATRRPPSADIANMMGVSRATVYRYPAKPTPATIASGTQVAGCNYDHRSSRGCAVTACASSHQLAKQLYDAQRVVDVRNERTPGTDMMSEARVDAVKAESTREVEPVLAIDGAGVHGSSKEETCAGSGSRGDVRCAVSCHRHNYA